MKLFVADYDGTLFVDDESLKENNKMLLELQEKNYKVVIDTGRSFPSIKNQIDIHSIPYDYLICGDGSILYDKDGNIIKMYEIDDKIIEPFKKFYQEISFEELQFSYKEGYSNILLSTKGLLGINICVATKKYTKELYDKFLKLNDFYPDYSFFSYEHPEFCYLCVKPKGITKATLITYLMNELHVDKNDVFVIGDSDNDHEMIREFDGVAMTTSYPGVLKIARKTYSNVSDYIKDILKED